MLKFIKKLFGIEKKETIDLLVICETIRQPKPIKIKQKRDKYGRFTK